MKRVKGDGILSFLPKSLPLKLQTPPFPPHISSEPGVQVGPAGHRLLGRFPDRRRSGDRSHVRPGMTAFILGQAANIPAMALAPQTMLSCLGGLSLVPRSSRGWSLLGQGMWWCTALLGPVHGQKHPEREREVLEAKLGNDPTHGGLLVRVIQMWKTVTTAGNQWSELVETLSSSNSSPGPTLLFSPLDTGPPKHGFLSSPSRRWMRLPPRARE